MMQHMLFTIAFILCAIGFGGAVSVRRWSGLYRFLLIIAMAALLCAEGAGLRGVAWDLPVASVLAVLAFLVVIRYRNDITGEE